MCELPHCKSNDMKSFYYCPSCLKINFPRLEVEELYDMYAETLTIVDWLIEMESYPDKEGVLPPNEFKDFMFKLYNDLILKKQEQGDEDG